MCGRTACTLCPAEVRKACSYRDAKSSTYRQPQWHDTSSVYHPSYNVCSTDATPVIVAGSHVDSCDQRVIMPMMWGMVPPWHKGNAKTHGLTTHNCRVEGLKVSKLYKVPLYAGKRCVIVCNGFYEWQTTKGNNNKQPYFIYSKQPDNVSILDDGKDGKWDEHSGWSGPNLLFIAGIFNTFTTPQGDVVYSYSMVTMESGKHFAWLHHRIPAVLETEQEIESWLNAKLVSPDDALTALTPVSSLCWHPVAKLVNSNRNKDPQCNKPVDTSSSLKSVAANNPMMKWLQSGVKKPAGGNVKTETRTETVIATVTGTAIKAEIEYSEVRISADRTIKISDADVKTQEKLSCKRPVEIDSNVKIDETCSRQAEKKSKPSTK